MANLGRPPKAPPGKRGQVVTVMFPATVDLSEQVEAWLADNDGFQHVPDQDGDNSHLKHPFKSAMFRRGHAFHIAKKKR